MAVILIFNLSPGFITTGLCIIVFSASVMLSLKYTALREYLGTPQPVIITQAVKVITVNLNK